MSVIAKINAFDDEYVGRIAMVIAMALSGTIGLFVVWSGHPAYNAIAYRCTIGLAVLFLYCRFFGILKFRNIPNKEKIYIIAGGVTLVLNWFFLFSAFNKSTIGITTVVYNIQPFLLVLLGFLIFREKLTSTAAICLGVSFAGLVVIVNPDLEFSGESISFLTGLFFAFVAAALYAVSTIFTKMVKSVRPEMVAVYHMIIGSALFLPFYTADFANAANAEAVYLVILGLLHTGVMYIFLYTAFSKATTASISVLSFIYPLVAVAADFIFFGTPLTLPQLVGSAMIIGSSYVYNTQKAKS
ncbi:Threonine/homoserine efflux transporter RhtA [Aliiroseovarius crassostreae]|nr:EamA family transporter [Aliiroseovarius crassostreae]SFU91969.1 Threonine/homoserine efflux transporter RhtA [Aliiroseovarius crassostreae]